jgi:hypothetical protein
VVFLKGRAASVIYVEVAMNIKFDDYRNKIFLHLLKTRNGGNISDCWKLIENECGAYPDGLGGILFDSIEGQTFFMLKYS